MSAISIPEVYLKRKNEGNSINEIVNDYIQDLYSFIQEYRNVWEWHVVDFYLYDSWNNPKIFPSEWKFLKNCTLDEILNMTSFHKIKDEWPESLKKYIKLTKEMSLIRNASEINLNKYIKVTNVDSKILIGMNPKKIHEVEILSSLISSIAKSQKIKNILDLGAGQAYLSSVLAYQHNFKVLGVDCDEIQICGASTRNEAIKKALIHKKEKENETKDNDDEDIGKLYMCNRLVTEKDTFSSLIEEITKKEEKVDINEPWLTCGLHACGNLTPSMIKSFIQGSSKAFVNIGCCYNLLTETDDNGNEKGFPLSDFSNSRKFELGSSARMLACQATSRWITQKDIKDTFKKHFYRAILQVIIHENNLLSEEHLNKPIIIGRLRKQHTKSFSIYAKAALKRLFITDEKIEKIDFDGYLEKYKEREGEIIAAWSLRGLISNAIESLILTDRWIFIEEQSKKINQIDKNSSIKAYLFPVFEQTTSPRNMALIAIKENKY